MTSLYNNNMVRAEILEINITSLKTSFKKYSHHVDSNSTKIKTYKGSTEPVLPREYTTTTSVNEKEFTQQSCSNLDNPFLVKFIQLPYFQGRNINSKEQEKKVTETKTLNVQQCTAEADLDEEYLDSKLQDSLNPDDYIPIICTLNLEADSLDSLQSDSFSMSESEPSSHSQLINSTQTWHKSSMRNSLEDILSSAQSESQKFEMLFQYESPKGSISVFDDDQGDTHFSELSLYDFSENSQYATESPTKCTEESELTLLKHQGNVCFSLSLESVQSEKLTRSYFLSDVKHIRSPSPLESNHPTDFETSFPAKTEQVLLVVSRIESNSLRNSLSLHGRSHCKPQTKISDQPFDGAFKINYETGQFNKPDTELDVIEKSHLIRSEIFCNGVQRQINVQNRIHYWRQVMQLYFTLLTTSSIVESLKWLFQLRLITIKALQRLQSFLNYPFNNLNEFFRCESSDSPLNDEECMSVEWMRLQTFQNYPDTANGSPSRLAKEGFYYTGHLTQTRCFSCGVTYGEWNYLDNPHEVHQRLSPTCPFLNGRQEGHRNIPLSSDGCADDGRACSYYVPCPSLPAATLTGSVTSQSQAEGIRSVPQHTEENERIRQHQSGSRETTREAPFHPVDNSDQSEADDRPKFPEHVTLSNRIETFDHGWPPYLDQTPQQMAEAGFFFTGNQDYTRCYQCGGGLRNWEPGDNPWIEHCRWYPMCQHVQKGKGQRFVNAVLKKQAELLSVKRAESRRKVQYGIGITDPLETLAAISLLEMGYPRDTIRNSILTLRRQKEPGTDITAVEVLDFIWREEDTERLRQEHEASHPHHPVYQQQPPLSDLMETLSLSGSAAVAQAVVQQTSPVSTTASSITTIAMTIKSVNTTPNSTPGILTVTSASTTTPALTMNSSTLSQGERQDKVQGHSTIAEGKGKKSGGSLQGEDASEGSIGRKAMAIGHDARGHGEQRPNVAMAEGQTEGPAARAQAIAAAINEDEEFHSFDDEQMENKDFRLLEEENIKLKEQATCKICMENQISIIFLPCAHLVCCETCAPAFRKCPICRKHIVQTVKTYL